MYIMVKEVKVSSSKEISFACICAVSQKCDFSSDFLELKLKEIGVKTFGELQESNEVPESVKAAFSNLTVVTVIK